MPYADDDAPINNDVGVGGLYVDADTCWRSMPESFSAMMLLIKHPEHEEIVTVLSKSLLATLNLCDSAVGGPYWSKRFGAAARLLADPDYPGAKFITDEVRSGLLVRVAVNG